MEKGNWKEDNKRDCSAGKGTNKAQKLRPIEGLKDR